MDNANDNIKCHAKISESEVKYRVNFMREIRKILLFVCLFSLDDHEMLFHTVIHIPNLLTFHFWWEKKKQIRKYCIYTAICVHDIDIYTVQQRKSHRLGTWTGFCCMDKMLQMLWKSRFLQITCADSYYSREKKPPFNLSILTDLMGWQLQWLRCFFYSVRVD